MTTTTREMYQEKVEAQLKVWTTWLAAAEARVEKASIEGKQNVQKELNELVKLEAAGKEHLAAVQAAAGHAWDDVKVEMANTWDRVSGSMDALWKRIEAEVPKH